MSDLAKSIQSLQAISQGGLAYAKDHFDKGRFEEIQIIASEMLSSLSGLSINQAKSFIMDEVGYRTPKIDVRAAVFSSHRILLVRERSDGLWTLPGGWADINESPKEAITREVLEETGLTVSPSKLAMIHDSNKRQKQFYHSYKLFFLCSIKSGELAPSNETSELAFFAADNLPELSSRRANREQIMTLFEHERCPNIMTAFD